MKKLTPAQRRAGQIAYRINEEAGVMPMVPAQQRKPGQPASGQSAPGAAGPTEQVPESDVDIEAPTGQQEDISLNDQDQTPPPQPMHGLEDPYAKHMENTADVDDASAESMMKVERIGAGLRKIIKASLELENAMAILKSERSDYSRGKALIDIRQELSNIVMQIKTELINLADHEPALADKVRDIIDNI